LIINCLAAYTLYKGERIQHSFLPLNTRAAPHGRTF